MMHSSVVVKITICACLLFDLDLLCGGDATGLGFHTRFTIIHQKLNFTAAEQACKDLGFDGLAIVSTPEEYNYILDASEELRQSTGLWVGMRFHPDLEILLWDDGTPPARDMPWLLSSPAPNLNYACVRIQRFGPLAMTLCTKTKRPICGNHTTKTFQEAMGSTHNAKRPANVTSVLATVKMKSYLQCVAFCGKQYTCRAAHFDLVAKTCEVLESISFTGLESRDDSVTFFRLSYEQCYC